MSVKFQQKYEQEMTERFYMRMTPDQKNLLQEAAQVVNREASELWRELFVGIAEGIVKESSGELSSAELKKMTGDLVLKITGLHERIKVSEDVKVEIVDG